MNWTVIIVTIIIGMVIIIWKIIDCKEIDKFSEMKTKKVKAIMKNRKNPLKQLRKSISK